MKLKLIEPLRFLFKDEARELGKELGIPEEIIGRHPFPGPGLAVRVLGAVTAERLELVRRADYIMEEEIRAAKLYDTMWQAFAVLLPVNSVGVMGDERTYENVVALRAVHSTDGMTANWVQLPYDVLAKIPIASSMKCAASTGWPMTFRPNPRRRSNGNKKEIRR